MCAPTVSAIVAAVAEAGGPGADLRIMSFDLESARRRVHWEAGGRWWRVVVGVGGRRRRGTIGGLWLGVHDEEEQGKGRMRRVFVCYST